MRRTPRSGRKPAHEKTPPSAIGWATPLPLSAPAALWCAAIVLFYYATPVFRSHAASLFDHLPALTAWKGPALLRAAVCCVFVLWLAVVGAGTGYLLLAKARLDFHGRLEAFSCGLGCGWGLLALALLAAGFLGAWRPWAVFPALVLLTVPGALGLRRLAALRPGPPLTAPEGWLLAPLCAAAALAWFGAFMPETFHDALVYHLAVPESYWRRHAVVPMPDNLFSGMPLLVQMLYAPGVGAGLEETSHLVNWSLAVATCALLIAGSLRFTGLRTAGLFAATVFFTAPIVGIMCFKASVELGWTFFQLLAVYALMVRLQGGESARRWTAAAGMFAGFSMGVKYPAWPIGAVLPAIAFWHLRREPGGWRAAAREAAWFAGIALLFMSAWPLKNWLLTGNPIYPYYDGLFNTVANSGWRDFGRPQRDIASLLSTWDGLRSLFCHPWTDLATPTGDAGALGVLLFMSIPFLLLTKTSSPAFGALRLTLLAGWLAWVVTSYLPRYFIPVTALAGFFAGLAVDCAMARRWQRVVWAAASAAAVMNLCWLAYWQHRYELAPVVLGAEDRVSFLSRMHYSYPAPPYAAIRHLDEYSPEGSKVLVLGDARVFRLRREQVSASDYDPHPLMRWLSESSDVAGLLRRYRENGVTHQLTSLAGIERARVGGVKRVLPFDEPEKMRLYDEFAARHLRDVFEFKPEEPGTGQLQNWLKVSEVVD